MSLAILIKDARIKAGYASHRKAQEAMAEAGININPTTLYRIEQGVTKPTLAHTVEICRFLGIDEAVARRFHGGDAEPTPKLPDPEPSPTPKRRKVNPPTQTLIPPLPQEPLPNSTLPAALEYPQAVQVRDRVAEAVVRMWDRHRMREHLKMLPQYDGLVSELKQVILDALLEVNK